MANTIEKITLYKGVLYVYLPDVKKWVQHRALYNPATLDFIEDQEGRAYKSVMGIRWETTGTALSAPGVSTSGLNIPTKREVALHMLEHHPTRAAKLDLLTIFDDLKDLKTLLMHPNKSVRMCAMRLAGKNTTNKKQESQQQEQDEQNQSR